jgi:hypothetical protein
MHPVSNYAPVTSCDLLLTDCASSQTHFHGPVWSTEHDASALPLSEAGRPSRRPLLPAPGHAPGRPAPSLGPTSDFGSISVRQLGESLHSRLQLATKQLGPAVGDGGVIPPPPRATPRQATPRPHPSQQTATPRRQRPDNLTRPEQDRVDRAVEFCADVVTDGWQNAVAGRAADCLTPKTWNRLFRGRRRRDCKALADLARAVLAARNKLHELIGRFAGWATGQLGGGGLERTAAREIAKRIPIPIVDQKAVLVARSLQMIGIALCLGRGDQLNRCQSFIDLALAETKERVKQILMAAMGDWTKPSDALAFAWGAGPGAVPDQTALPADLNSPPASIRIHLPRR